jgi:hypothetical protein
MGAHGRRLATEEQAHEGDLHCRAQLAEIEERLQHEKKVVAKQALELDKAKAELLAVKQGHEAIARELAAARARLA